MRWRYNFVVYTPHSTCAHARANCGADSVLPGLTTALPSPVPARGSLPVCCDQKPIDRGACARVPPQERDWETALGLLATATLDFPGAAPNAVVYTAAMGACGAAGRWEEAVALLDEMETVQVRRRFKKTRAHSCA